LNKNTVWGLVIILIVVFGFYLFFNSQQQNTQAPQEQINLEQQVSEGDDVDEMVAESEVREILIEGDEFAFTPSTITVEEGEKIALTFRNVGTFPHNFMIDELGVKSATIEGGEEDVVEFVADQGGAFAFYCSVGNHRQQGMEGEVSVE